MNKQYHVITSTDLNEFIQEVNRFTQGGWEAQGGVFAIRGWVTQPVHSDVFQIEMFDLPQDVKLTKIMYCQAVVSGLDDDNDDDEELE
jgi:hypothetical protein